MAGNKNTRSTKQSKTNANKEKGKAVDKGNKTPVRDGIATFTPTIQWARSSEDFFKKKKNPNEAGPNYIKHTLPDDTYQRETTLTGNTIAIITEPSQPETEM